MCEEEIFNYIHTVYENSLRHVNLLVDKKILRYAEIGATRPEVFKLKFNPQGFKEITGYGKKLGKVTKMVSNDSSIKAFDKVLNFIVLSAYYKEKTSNLDEYELKIIQLTT